jgi:hypothetical protein
MDKEAIVPAPVSVDLDGSRLILRGPLTGRLAQAPNLADFLARCLRLGHLKHLRFELPSARIELRFATAHDAEAAARHDLAAQMKRAAPRSQPWGKAFLEHIGHQVWDTPVTLYRSGAVLSTWRLRSLGEGRVRLSHPLLRARPTAALVAARLKQLGGAVVPGSWRRQGMIDLQCDDAGPDTVLNLVAEAEAIEAALALSSADPIVSPVGSALLLNVNLLLAAGAIAAPVLAWPSALVLAGASIPVFRQSWQHLRNTRLDMTTVLACLSILALVSGDRLPAALMLWMFRLWDVLTRRSLRRAEIALFERLAVAAPPDPQTLRCAAEATTRIFADAPRARAAKAFADSSAPWMLCVGAAAVFSGGPPLAQAVMRPDFFSPVLVHRRMAAAEVAVRLAALGCVVRSFQTLLELRDTDQLILDDSVDWEADVDFGDAIAEFGLREILYFHRPGHKPSAELVAALGRPNLIERSLVQTPAAYLSHQRFLGHKLIYARAVDSRDRVASSDVTIAVGENCLVDERDAPVGLIQPSLRRLLEVMQLVRTADAEERAVKTGTAAVNTVMVVGAAYAGLSTLGIVAISSVATAGLWAGLRRRVRKTARTALVDG